MLHKCQASIQIHKTDLRLAILLLFQNHPFGADYQAFHLHFPQFFLSVSTEFAKARSLLEDLITNCLPLFILQFPVQKQS